MKKGNTDHQSSKKLTKASVGPITIGMDVGDKTSRYCVLDGEGKVVAERSTATTRKGMAQVFGAVQRCRIALEVGTHSRWIERLLKGYGHEVIVANSRQLPLITASSRKDDRQDAEMLARIARMDPSMLRPIRHRGEKAQSDLTKIRVRAALLEARTGLINAARGFAKAAGERIPRCDADNFGMEQIADFSAEQVKVLEPLVRQIESLTETIKESGRELEQIARKEYPETELLRQVQGVGLLIALTFVLTIEEAERFGKSRDVGSYVGLRPKRSESGERKPQLRITKEGDNYLRKMLVQGAHYILGPKGPDTDLRRWGLKLAGRGGKYAKKRAIVAVARKLAILLHRLWVTGEVYEPLRNSQAAAARKAA